MKTFVFCLILLLEPLYGLDLRDWLRRLDERIYKALEYGAGNGTNLFESVTTYNGYLYHLSNTDQEWTVDPYRKLEKVEALKKKCWLGPKFLTANYSVGSLKSKFGFNDKELKEIDKLIEETKCLFAEIEEQGVVKNRLKEIDSKISLDSYRWTNW